MRTSLASAGLVHVYCACSVLVFAVVSAQMEEAIELFVRRKDAERFVAEVRGDEPELAELLSVEPVELDA